MDFRTDYYTPMDRAYHSESPRRSAEAHMQEPIIPMYRLGITVPEMDPSGRHKHMIQGVQAAIRAGVGELQLVMNIPHTQAVGGRPKGYGKEFREVMKEVLRANEAKLVGVELPTSITNLSGLSMENNIISEQQQKQELDEVRDTIRFVAEVAGGGGVDVVSWEFPRFTVDQPWNKQVNLPDGKVQPLFEAFPNEKERLEIRFVDKRTGQIQGVAIKEGMWLHKDPERYVQVNGRLEPAESPTAQLWDYNKIKEYEEKTGRNAVEFVKENFIDAQIKSAEGERARFKRLFRQSEREFDLARTEDQQLAREIQLEMESFKESIKSAERTIAELRARRESWEPLEDYAFERSASGYAEAGLIAMEETHNRPDVRQPIHVGPELGWPYFFGGHPQEFKKLVEAARNKMAERLVDERDFSPEQAMHEAKTHIKGLFDTAHMGMWLQYFKHLPGESEDDRIKRFNKWYVEEVKKLAESDVVGSMQLVDSASGAHGHLPPGQGIFPVVETAKEFQKRGFDGFMVSEGHEEERFGEGRIFLKTWEAFGGQVPAGFFAQPRPWSEVHNAYARQTYSPKQMFGFYTPPFGEYRPWAGGDNPIPFE